jgi:outer membrane immunogenic protein
MRKILLAGVAAAALTAVSSAMAADLGTPVYKVPPAPVAVAPNWTGFYIGANGGGGWGTQEFFESDPFSGKALSSIGVNGFLGGGQVGYNYQTGWLVLGVEGSFDWANINGDGPLEGDTFSANTDWLANVTGRVGGTVDHALLYVKGGVAWAHDKYDINEIDFDYTGSATRTGALLGAGIEYAFTPHWSGRVEYNFMDFGKNNVTFCEDGVDCEAYPIKQYIHTVTVGLNYKFDWGAPAAWSQ